LYLYPNPAVEFVKIPGLASPLGYEIQDLLGVKVLKGLVFKNSGIDIQNQTVGLYVVRFENGRVLKFIKN
jgi:hypothetical protein